MYTSITVIQVAQLRPCTKLERSRLVLCLSEVQIVLERERCFLCIGGIRELFITTYSSLVINHGVISVSKISAARVKVSSKNKRRGRERESVCVYVSTSVRDRSRARTTVPQAVTGREKEVSCAGG